MSDLVLTLGNLAGPLLVLETLDDRLALHHVAVSAGELEDVADHVRRVLRRHQAVLRHLGRLTQQLWSARGTRDMLGGGMTR